MKPVITKKHLLLLLFCIAQVADVFSQSYNFRSYSVEEGLPQSQVYKVFQDSKGYLWIGTFAGGATRFDGKSFKIFSEKEGLVNNTVYDIEEGVDKTIWVATNEGLCLISDSKIKTYTVKDGLPSDMIYSLFSDHKGVMWIGTNEGICYYKNNKFVSFKQDTILGKVKVRAIAEDRERNIWLGTNDGAVKYTRSQSFLINKLQGLNSNKVRAIACRKNGEVWIATEAGVNVVTSEVRTVEDSLLKDKVYSVFEDNSGYMWVGTEAHGLINFQEDSRTNFNTSNGLNNNGIRSITQDKEGNIWLGTNGGGISKFEGRRFIHYTTSDGLSNNIVMTFFEDSSRLYMGTFGGGVSVLERNRFSVINNNNGLSNNAVLSITKAPDGSTWFGTYNGITSIADKKVKYLNVADGLPHHNIFSLLNDDQNMWVGTFGGIAVYDGKEFKNFSEKESSSTYNLHKDAKGRIWIASGAGVSKYENGSFKYFDKELPPRTIARTIAEDNTGTLWFGTEKGLLSFDGNKWSSLTEKDGLTSNSIPAIACDGQFLWIGTSKGVDRLDLTAMRKGKKLIKNYGRSEGFKGIECNQNAIYKDRNGTVWLGTINGATKYTPSEDRLNSVEPQTHVTGLKLFLQEVNWDSLYMHTSGVLPTDLVLEHDKNHLTFSFIGISFTSPEKVKYRWRLDGFDKEWSPESFTTEVTYSNLPPGKYSFQVLASNNDGIWNKVPAQYEFEILKPFWLTTWFFLSCAVLLILLVLLIISLRTKKLKRAKSRLEEQVRLRTYQLEEANNIVAQKNKDITDSILYAKRIQNAILPLKGIIENEFPKSFIYFNPKDIVSGDFYWFAKKDERVVLVVADCTGHGVPGALMSMIGNDQLNQIVIEKGITDASEILSNLNRNIKQALKQTDAQSESKDGMDISVCVFNYDKTAVQYAGAHRPLCILRAGANAVDEIKGDKTSIGGITDEKFRFTSTTLFLNPHDRLYMFTDGFADQFGGERGKKFMKRHFKETLLSFKEQPIKHQEQMLNEILTEWKRDLMQVDDICVIGIEV